MNRRDQELQLQLTTLEFLATVLRSEGVFREEAESSAQTSRSNVFDIEEGKRLRAKKRKAPSRVQGTKRAKSA